MCSAGTMVRIPSSCRRMGRLFDGLRVVGRVSGPMSVFWRMCHLTVVIHSL